jgi:hypothetical protein
MPLLVARAAGAGKRCRVETWRRPVSVRLVGPVPSAAPCPTWSRAVADGMRNVNRRVSQKENTAIAIRVVEKAPNKTISVVNRRSVALHETRPSIGKAESNRHFARMLACDNSTFFSAVYARERAQRLAPGRPAKSRWRA